MSAEQATLVVAGAVGGMIYPVLGYFKAKKTEDNVSFDFNQFLKPVFYGAVIGVIGVFLSPMMGMGEIVDLNSAVSAGMAGAVIIEKLLKAEQGDIKSIMDKVVPSKSVAKKSTVTKKKK